MRAFLANEATADVNDLDTVIIVVTMNGNEMAKLRAAISVVTDMAASIHGAADVRSDLLPLYAALDDVR